MEAGEELPQPHTGRAGGDLGRRRRLRWSCCSSHRTDGGISDRRPQPTTTSATDDRTAWRGTAPSAPPRWRSAVPPGGGGADHPSPAGGAGRDDRGAARGGDADGLPPASIAAPIVGWGTAILAVVLLAGLLFTGEAGADPGHHPQPLISRLPGTLRVYSRHGRRVALRDLSHDERMGVVGSTWMLHARRRRRDRLAERAVHYFRPDVRGTVPRRRSAIAQRWQRAVETGGSTGQ